MERAKISQALRQLVVAANEAAAAVDDNDDLSELAVACDEFEGLIRLITKDAAKKE